jgi:serine/threonine protein kinase
MASSAQPGSSSENSAGRDTSDSREPSPLTPSFPASSDSNLTGRKLGQYTILEKIGQGGMGLVFKAFDNALERSVALKVIFSGPLDDPKHSQRFSREARNLARLNHPNLLHVYNVGSDSDCHYFAMELLTGVTLVEEIRRRKRIPAEELLLWAGQILSALHYVHRQGITHRDIKSGNIMLCEHRAVLMDFGLAKDDNDSGLTSIGMVLGTPDYISPEAADGQSAGAPTDIYSLGVVLYEALTGALPFTGRSALSIMKQHMEAPPPPIAGMLPNVDPLLAAVVHKCMAKKPAERYPDCIAMARDLVRLQPTTELVQLADAGSNAFGSAARRTVVPPPLIPEPSAVTLLDRELESRKPSGTAAPTIVASSNSPIEETMTMASVPAASVGPQRPSRRHSPWVWAGVGFFGVFFLLFLLIALGKRNKDGVDKNTGLRMEKPALEEWRGQPVTIGGISDEMEWWSFEADKKNPADSVHIFRQRQPDGTWKTVTMRQSELDEKMKPPVFIFSNEEPKGRP